MKTRSLSSKKKFNFSDHNLLDQIKNRPGESPDSKTAEKNEFLKLYHENYTVTPNSKWHVICSSWFAKWQTFMDLGPKEILFELKPFTDVSESFPGKINNSEVLEKTDNNDILIDSLHPYYSYCLKPGLVEGSDYVLIPDPAFKILADKYGIVQDIIRYAIEQNDTIYQIEIFLKFITIAYIENNQLIIQNINTSRKNTIGYIKKLIQTKLNLNSYTRIWKVDTTKLPISRLKTISNQNFCVYIEGSAILEENTMIDDADISENNVILIEFLVEKSNYKYSDDFKIALGKCAYCQVPRLSVSCKICSKKLYCSLDCLKTHGLEHRRVCKPRKRLFINFFSCFCRSSANMSDTEEEMLALSPIKKANFKILIGLQNLGNTCFMNSAIQCLCHTKPLTDFFLGENYLNKINKNNPLGTKGKLVHAYAELLHLMRDSTEKSVAPWKLKKTIAMFAPQFLGHQQHDAQELLLFLISGLHEDLNQVTKKPYYNTDIKETTEKEMASESWARHISRNQSLIIDLMYGQYKSTLHCPKCQKYSYAFDPFSCLSLPIPQELQKKVNIIFVPYSSLEIITNFNFVTDPTTKISGLVQKVSNYLKKNKQEITPMLSKDSSKVIIDGNVQLSEINTNNLYFYELSSEFTEFVVMNITKGSTFAVECYSRILGISPRSTLVDLHTIIFKYLQPFFGKKAENENFLTFLENKVYKVFYDASKFNLCAICGDRRCQGCEINPELRKLSFFFTSQKFFTVNVSILKNYSSIAMDFTQLKRLVQAKMPQESILKRNITIDDCFKMFGLPEVLDKNNLWFCPTCKVHVQASKKLEIYKVPPILVIHLKRFKTQGHHRDKLNVPIEFPTKGLDISNYTIGEKPPIYDLYAVSNHFGALAGGHYTASIYSESKDVWYNCNDADITECKQISDISAYVLFYRSRNL
jgi:ubiquitin carboxyl-terminal hydrolase 4/11